MSEWITTTVGKLGKVVTGKTPSKNNPEDWGNEYLFITPSDYGNYNKSANHSIRGFSEEGYKRHKVRMIPKHSCLVTCIGSDMGKVVMNAEDAFCNQQINALIPNTSIIDSDYAYYFFKDSALILKTLGSDGTAVPILNKSDFEKIELSIPPLPEQKAIASVLSSLDDKIDLLHRQNKILEAMAETLFRQWFIEDTAGKTELITLGEMIEIHDSKRIPLSKLERDKKKNGSIMYPYYGAAKIMDYVDDYIFDGDYLLLGEDGTVQDENGYPILQRANGKYWVNNHAHVLSAKAPYNNFFLWCLLSKTNIEKAVTGAVQPKINQENLRKLDFVKFDESKVLDFNDITSSMLNKLNTNNLQIQTLENLRDTLLPKLMSGEVRVQYQTEEVA